MKKLLLCAVFAVFAMSSLHAQEFKAGVNVGLPMGDIKDYSSLNIGVEVNYLWAVSDEFKAGLSAGYNTYLGKDGYDALGYLPIAAAGRFNISEDLTIGADLGYAIGVNPSGIDSGFYYAPKLQYGVSESIDLVLAYKGISVNGASLSSLNLGIEFGL
ncbi:MAG TPA: outer membrane beta-barrel protein [Mariniflexile sp.]|nr:outer membrane beta-barrel protein [Mariniflexile sp.]